VPTGLGCCTPRGASLVACSPHRWSDWDKDRAERSPLFCSPILSLSLSVSLAMAEASWSSIAAAALSPVALQRHHRAFLWLHDRLSKP